MSTQLTFKRPGGVRIEVSTYDGRFLDLRVSQHGGRRGARVSKSIVSAYAPLKHQLRSCHICEIEGEWSLVVGYATAWLRPDEAQQVAERFQIEIRHAAPNTKAPAEAQPCHP